MRKPSSLRAGSVTDFTLSMGPGLREAESGHSVCVNPTIKTNYVLRAAKVQAARPTLCRNEDVAAKCRESRLYTFLEHAGATKTCLAEGCPGRKPHRTSPSA